MNKIQKILTGVALLVFFISLASASWTVTATSQYAGTRTWSTTAPIWDGPGNQYATATLQSGVLFVEWAAIGIVYAALMFFFKKKKG